jgi:hypothetical protein
MMSAKTKPTLVAFDPEVVLGAKSNQCIVHFAHTGRPETYLAIAADLLYADLKWLDKCQGEALHKRK